ncbi:MAG: pyruvate, orthophosphate dikinase [Actinomycetota bacterium]|jgi:pyruvate,orthophosphate dikinase|nr:pyruvate, orthophosphate dikinase [Actinomycetota bacterium]
MTSGTRTQDVIALDGSRDLPRELVGGKAYSLNRMRKLGMPVPPAFAITVDVCPIYRANGNVVPEPVWEAALAQLTALERDTGRRFGCSTSPLLVSVRSGAARSMPGMMDTVLNLGLTEELRDALAGETGDPHWAADTWTRFCHGYTDIVGLQPPADPYEQLRAAIGAVFRSWFSERAVAYRRHHRIADLPGTAVTVQAMAFGNRDEQSGTGVLFSRNPVTGEPGLYGEWLPQAQGEDVVSGARTPLPLSTLADDQPKNHQRLTEIAAKLEADGRDMVDVEFTIESGRLYVLQARAGKRSARAAARIAVDMVADGLIDQPTALDRISVDHARQLTEGQVLSGPGAAELARGLGAGPGVGSGVAVTDIDEALRLAEQGSPFVLVRPSTSPDDVPAMFAAAAVVTEHGGATSHAALVCREIGVPCVVGCGDGTVARLLGREITVDGGAAAVYDGDLSVSGPEEAGRDEVIDTLTAWAGMAAGMPSGERSLVELIAALRPVGPA